MRVRRYCALHGNLLKRNDSERAHTKSGNMKRWQTRSRHLGSSTRLSRIERVQDAFDIGPSTCTYASECGCFRNLGVQCRARRKLPCENSSPLAVPWNRREGREITYNSLTQKQQHTHKHTHTYVQTWRHSMPTCTTNSIPNVTLWQAQTFRRGNCENRCTTALVKRQKSSSFTHSHRILHPCWKKQSFGTI